MSLRALKKAARMKDPRMDLGHRIALMLIADRSDRRGRLVVDNDETLMTEMAAETNAIMKRLAGDELVIFGVDNARVTRVVDALKEAEEGG